MLISKRRDIAIEQIKLIATALNTLGSGALILGFLRPILATEEVRFELLGLVFAFALALVLYFAANRVLMRLPLQE